MCEKVGTMLMEKALVSSVCSVENLPSSCHLLGDVTLVATLQEAGRQWRTALSVLSLPTCATLALSFVRSVVCITKRVISCGL